jgi:hypothetical protein
VKGLSNELMQLRKICQHPFLFESVEDKINPSGIVDDKLVRCSGKIELLARILPKFFATGHRVCCNRRCLSNASISFGRVGSHILPDDKSHGHHGGFLENDAVAVFETGWWDEDGRKSRTCTDVQCERLGDPGVHLVNKGRWIRVEFANC